MNYLWLDKNRGKLVLVTSSIFIWLLLLIAFKYYGYEKTWQLWKVETEQPAFLDFRLIPGSAESFRHGFEPTIKNPYDPAKRIFNYPAFWRLFFYTGITEDDTVWISITMIVLFFVGVLLLPDSPKISDAIAILFVIFCPASMLLYERGNVDLIVFVICVLIILAEGYSAYLAAGLLVFGAVVKLFPIFGVTGLLCESKTKFLWLTSGCLLALTAYIYKTFGSIKASWDSTMRGKDFSYGTNVLVTHYTTWVASHWFSFPFINFLLKYGPLGVALLFLALVFFAAPRNLKFPAALSERNLAAFRMGASIYVGTFLLGNNWDYRLAFLVLIIPQLMEWIRSNHRVCRIMAYIGMATILLSGWYLIISAWQFFAGAKEFWFVFDEIMNWILFIDLAYLLFASVPSWVRELVHSFFSIKKPAQVVKTEEVQP